LAQEYLIQPNLQSSFGIYLSKNKCLIELELSKLISKYSHLRLHELIEYAVSSHGKRLRPLMVIMSAQSVGGNKEKVMNLALAVELLHTATLIHDDILDQDKFRRDALTVHEKWSINDAILAGDIMISLAINLIADYGKDVMKIASETGLALCDGEFMDLSMSSLKISEEDYLEKIRKKSASLFRTATQCGAIAGGGTDLEIKSLAAFGEHLGMAYQIGDDISDITTVEGNIPKDLKERRISLPLIHLFNSSNSVERELLQQHLQLLETEDNSLKKEAFHQISSNLKTKGSLNYCIMKTNNFIDQAIIDIQNLKDSNFKGHLVHMANLIKQNVGLIVS
jgi:geranylgeranyl pyrophosphate synthase